MDNLQKMIRAKEGYDRQREQERIRAQKVLEHLKDLPPAPGSKRAKELDAKRARIAAEKNFVLKKRTSKNCNGSKPLQNKGRRDLQGKELTESEQAKRSKRTGKTNDSRIAAVRKFTLAICPIGKSKKRMRSA